MLRHGVLCGFSFSDIEAMCHTQLTLHVNVTKFQETQRKMSFVIYYVLALADTLPTLLGRVGLIWVLCVTCPFTRARKRVLGNIPSH